MQEVLALVRTLAAPCDTLAFGARLRGPLVGMTEAELLSAAEIDRHGVDDYVDIVRIERLGNFAVSSGANSSSSRVL